MFKQFTLSQKIILGFGLAAMMMIFNSMTTLVFLNKAQKFNHEIISQLSSGEKIPDDSIIESISALNNRVRQMIFISTAVSLFLLVAVAFIITKGVVSEGQGNLDNNIKREIYSIKEITESILKKM